MPVEWGNKHQLADSLPFDDQAFLCEAEISFGCGEIGSGFTHGSPSELEVLIGDGFADR
jgi:hypothetical protein